MRLIKVKGIVIREVAYKDNDKIITILTDSLGKVSAIAKGAKKTNSPYLASSQFLVYSEFVLYQNTGYFYLNSASVINTFYNVRVDFDKLQIVFEMTKILNSVTDENQDCEKILQLFLNTIYALDKLDKDRKLRFLSCVGEIELIDEIPADFSVLMYLVSHDPNSLVQYIRNRIDTSKVDVLFTPIIINNKHY